MTMLRQLEQAEQRRGQQRRQHAGGDGGGITAPRQLALGGLGRLGGRPAPRGAAGSATWITSRSSARAAMRSASECCQGQRRCAAADDQPRQVVLARITHQRRAGLGRGRRGDGRAQFLRQLEHAQRLLAPRLGQPVHRRRLDMHRVPRHLELRRQAGAGAHHLVAVLAACRCRPAALRGWARPTAPSCVAGRPASRRRRGRRCGAAPARAAPAGCPCGRSCAAARSACCGQVDLAGLQPLQQFVGRQVDHHHLVGLVEQPVGHGLPDADAGDAADDVVQALQVLHVHRRPDVDAGVEQLLDVLPALGVARARRVAVRQFVEQHQRLGMVLSPRPARRRGRTPAARGRGRARPSAAGAAGRAPSPRSPRGRGSRPGRRPASRPCACAARAAASIA